MNTPRPPRRAQGFSSTVCRFGTYSELMMSSPSLLTQRVYGVSFSVANFFANSSETTAFLAMLGSFNDSRHAAHGDQPGSSTHCSAFMLDRIADRRARRDSSQAR